MCSVGIALMNIWFEVNFSNDIKGFEEAETCNHDEVLKLQMWMNCVPSMIVWCSFFLATTIAILAYSDVLMIETWVG